MTELPINTELAGLIRTGLTMMDETHNAWFLNGEEIAGCALGLAVAAKYGIDEGYKAYQDRLEVTQDQHNPLTNVKVLSELLDIPYPLAYKINELHCGTWSAEDIADELEGTPRI